MERLIVTTGRKDSAQNKKAALFASEELNVPYAEREQKSLDDLRREHDANGVIVAKKKQYFLFTDEGEIFFHPGMAHLRVKNLRLGLSDRLIDTMKLKEGMSVLDCTMGLAADAITCAVVTGESGNVTAIEKSRGVAFVIGYGLKHLTGDNYDIHAAMRRINVICAEHLEYLKSLPDKSFDVVYFDPMFRRPLEKSLSMKSLRSVAATDALTEETIREAKRVAKERVVLKENAKSKEFERLGFTKTASGKYSKVSYGVIELD